MKIFNNSEMSSGSFSSCNTPFDLQGSYDLQDYEIEAAVHLINGKHKHLFGIQENVGQDRENDLVFPHEYGVAKEPEEYHGEQQQLGMGLGKETKLDCSSHDQFNFSSVFSANMELQEFSRPEEDIQVKPVKEMTPSFQLSSLELLNSYGNVFKKLKMGKSSSIDPASTDDTNNKPRGPKNLSPDEIMRVAGARYVQFFDMRYDDFSMVLHPFGQALSELSDEETKDVELVHLLADGLMQA